MNYLIDLINKLICLACLVAFVISCSFDRGQCNDYNYDVSGMYYSYYEKTQYDNLHYIFLLKDGLYINVLEYIDSALVNVNKWRKPYPNSSYVKFEGFVPIGYLWKCSIWWNKDKYDSTYIFRNGISSGTESQYGLFYDPDGRYTFSKIDIQIMIDKNIIPREYKSIEDVEKHLCINDSSIFEGVRKMSKSELRTLLWGE